jgi:hypothetical protein
MRLRSGKTLLLASGAVILVTAVGVTGAVLGTHRNGQKKSMATLGVNPTFTPNKVSVDRCKDNDRDCLEQGYGNLSYETTAKKALGRLAVDMQKDQSINSLCHPIAHAIGAGSLLRNKGDVGASFAEGDSTCWSGYYHGVLERAFVGVPASKTKQVAAQLCDTKSVQESRFLLYQCVHGLGHGVMLHLGYDLPKALKVCEYIKDPWESNSCDSGVFMENVVSSRRITSKWLRDDDPIFPCKDVADRHRYYCYQMVTSRINELNGFNWADTAQTCLTKAEVKYRPNCFESYGRDASGARRNDLPSIKKLCDLTKGFVDSCVYGVTRDMTSQDSNGTRAAKFCTLVDPVHQPKCYEGIGTIIVDQVGAANVTQECARLAGRYKIDCMTGAGVPLPAGSPI